MGQARLRGTPEQRRAAALVREETERAVSAWLRQGSCEWARPGEHWTESLSCEAAALGFDAAWWARERFSGRAPRVPARRRPVMLSLLLAAAALRWS